MAPDGRYRTFVTPPGVMASMEGQSYQKGGVSSLVGVLSNRTKPRPCRCTLSLTPATYWSWVVGSEPVHAVAQQNGENRMKQFEGEQQFYIIVASTLI